MLASDAKTTTELHLLCANRDDLEHTRSTDSGATWTTSDVTWMTSAPGGAGAEARNTIDDVVIEANGDGTDLALASGGTIYFGSYADVAELTVTSTAFAQGAAIPDRYACEGTDVSPPVAWTGIPAGTRSIVVIVDDPDARRFVHWVIYEIPANLAGLDENIPRQNTLANGARQGRNDFGTVGYGGPCPPGGTNHRYLFRVYALDTMLRLASGATRAQVDAAMRGHVIGRGELMGTFSG
jgi:Raf kinase inhibitor-like YbhB/YbcL family protein